MNLKSSIDKILDQWPAKVICLVIAIFLYVFHQVSLIDKKTFVVPLTVKENGNVVHMGTIPNSVGVIVKTSSENMKLITQNELKAIVDLDTIAESGTYEVPITLIIADNLLVLDPLEVKLKEESIKVEVDKKTFKYVNIEPSVVGTVAHGYEIESISINPSTTKITGPEKILQTIETVSSSRVNVTNAETSFSQDIDVIINNKLVTMENEETYKAEIHVAPQYIEKDFDVPVDFMNLPEQFTYTSDISNVTIKLLGTVNYLEDYHVPRRSIQIYLGDITEPGTYELPLRFYFSKNTEILEKSAEIVTVVISEKETEPEVSEEETVQQ